MSSATSSSYIQPPRINRMPSVKELVGANSLQSPLTQLRVGVESRRDDAQSSIPRTRSTPSTSLASSSSSTSRPKPTAPPVPPIDFNLFRSNSVYSVDSVSSMSTVTTDDDGPLSFQDAAAAITRPESPTTPKASHFQGRDGYFDTHAQAGPSRLQGALNTSSLHTLTPKKSFVVRSRNSPPSPIHPQSAFESRTGFSGRQRSQSRPELPSRSRSHIREAPQHQLDAEDTTPDFASVHGEQGSDWGEDEDEFEWLDSRNVPEAANGKNKMLGGGGLSPSKRLSKIKAAVTPVVHGPGNEGNRLRKQLTFARRAPPPPMDKAPAPPPLSFATTTAAPVPTPTPADLTTEVTPPSTARPGGGLQRGLSRSKRFHGIPLQPTTSQPTAGGGRPTTERSQSTPTTVPADNSRQPVPNRKPQTNPHQMAHTLVPLKDDRVSAPMTTTNNQSRNSQMSFQSVAYSLYDLDGDSTSPLPSPAPGVDLVFPKGRYTRVKASMLDTENEKRLRKGSERSMGSGQTIGRNDAYKTPEEYVSAGIEARGRGDLAKSAWYFMQATEGGSLTGKMYYGLALRHGWGIAKDERKAFILLRQACDESLAAHQAPSMDIQQSPGVIKLSLAQKKGMAKDLSMGLFEIANCFLEGSGTKKSPDVALSYLKLAGDMGDLASQEQLGFLLSKGSSGVKKDMKEAARWYRMAIGQGSSNTFGLAWVWKEKYMV